MLFKNVEDSDYLKNILLSLRKYIPDFEQECCKDLIPWFGHGIGNIEAFYYWSLIKHLKPKVVLESGIKHGRSTRIIGKACHQINAQHFAFDIDKIYPQLAEDMKQYPNSHLYNGDSCELFYVMMDRQFTAPVICFIDGPKTPDKYKELIKQCSKFPNCLAIISHDCYPKSICRKYFEYCVGKFFKDVSCVIPNTDFNKDLFFLNKYIYDDANKNKSGKRGDTLNTTSQYIGICLKN